MTNLGFGVAYCNHVLEETVQDAFNLEEKGCSITFFRVEITRYGILGHRTPGSTSKSIKGI